MADADWATAVDVQEGIKKINLPKTEKNNRKHSNESNNGFDDFDEGK